MSRSRTQQTLQDRMRRWHEYVQQGGPENLPMAEPPKEPEPADERGGLPVLHHESVINRQQEKIYLLEEAVRKEHDQALRLAEQLARERSRHPARPHPAAWTPSPPDYEPYSEPPQDDIFPLRRPSRGKEWIYCLVVALFAVAFALLITYTD